MNNKKATGRPPKPRPETPLVGVTKLKRIPHNEDRVFSVSEVARLVGISVSLVRYDIAKKRLKVYQPYPGSKIFVKRVDADAYLAWRTAGALTLAGPT